MNWDHWQEVHMVFDVLAWVAAFATGYSVNRWQRFAFGVSQPQRGGYYAALIFGSGVGAYIFGTANLWLSGQAGIARSIEGALAGALIAVEIYKWQNRIAGRTARALRRGWQLV